MCLFIIDGSVYSTNKYLVMLTLSVSVYRIREYTGEESTFGLALLGHILRRNLISLVQQVAEN